MFKYVAYTKVTDEFTTHEFREQNEKCKVNRFDVPYVSVEFENESDFIELMANQNTLIQATEITKDEFASAVSGSAQVVRMIDIANELFKEIMKPISGKYSKEERDTWSNQIEEARAVVAGATNTTILGAIADSEGINIQDFAQSILDKKTAYEVISADALVQKRAKLAELKAGVGL